MFLLGSNAHLDTGDVPKDMGHAASLAFEFATDDTHDLVEELVLDDPVGIRHILLLPISMMLLEVL